MAQTGRTIGALGAGWVFVSVSPSAVFLLGGLGILAAMLVFSRGPPPARAAPRLE